MASPTIPNTSLSLVRPRAKSKSTFFHVALRQVGLFYHLLTVQMSHEHFGRLLPGRPDVRSVRKKEKENLRSFLGRRFAPRVVGERRQAVLAPSSRVGRGVRPRRAQVE